MCFLIPPPLPLPPPPPPPLTLTLFSLFLDEWCYSDAIIRNADGNVYHAACYIDAEKVPPPPPFFFFWGSTETLIEKVLC